MPDKIVAIMFTFRHGDDTLERFGPGDVLPAVCDRSCKCAIAEHPFALAHTVNPPYFPPKPGTPEYAREDAERRRRKTLLDAVSEQDIDAARQAEEHSRQDAVHARVEAEEARLRAVAEHNRLSAAEPPAERPQPRLVNQDGYRPITEGYQPGKSASTSNSSQAQPPPPSGGSSASKPSTGDDGPARQRRAR